MLQFLLQQFITPHIFHDLYELRLLVHVDVTFEGNEDGKIVGGYHFIDSLTNILEGDTPGEGVPVGNYWTFGRCIPSVNFYASSRCPRRKTLESCSW